MTRRDALYPGWSLFIVETGRIEWVRGPSLIAPLHTRPADSFAEVTDIMQPAHESLWLRSLEAQA